jgi:hypothetical protein
MNRWVGILALLVTRPCQARSRDPGTRYPGLPSRTTPAAARRTRILMRFVEAQNRPPTGRPAERHLVRALTRLSRDARRRLPSVAARRALVVQWELSLGDGSGRAARGPRPRRRRWRWPVASHVTGAGPGCDVPAEGRAESLTTGRGSNAAPWSSGPAGRPIPRI